MEDVKSVQQTLIVNRSTPHNKHRIKYFVILASLRRCALDAQIPQKCAAQAIENAETLSLPLSAINN